MDGAAFLLVGQEVDEGEPDSLDDGKVVQLPNNLGVGVWRHRSAQVHEDVEGIVVRPLAEELGPRLQSLLAGHGVDGVLEVLRELESVEEHVRLDVEVLAEAEDEALPWRR